jgi:hypothetical protein
MEFSAPNNSFTACDFFVTGNWELLHKIQITSICLYSTWKVWQLSRDVHHLGSLFKCCNHF